MSPEVLELKNLIENSDNIVFLVAPVYLPKATYLILEVKTVFIMR